MMLVGLVAIAASVLNCAAFTTTSRHPSTASSILRQRPLSIGRTTILAPQKSLSSSSLCARPEFSIDEEDEDEDDYDEAFDHAELDSTVHAKRNEFGDLMLVNEDSTQYNDYNTASSDPQQRQRQNRPKMEYGYLRPGTVVQIQIGDLNLARKAWKKRRRTGSPLLVPCSVLNVDRLSMVRWNLLFLLEKFGRKMANSNRDPGIEISLVSLARTYRTFLKSSFQRQVDALGFESSEEMIKTLFNKKIQEAYGVMLEERLEQGGKSMLYLTAPISRTKAQKRAANAPMMQFRLFEEGDYGDSDTLTHTGFVRALKEYKVDEERDYEHLPLSAAIRVSQKEDVDSGRVEEGRVLSAAIFDYDRIGDGGSPLLTLTLDPGSVREQLKYKDDRRLRNVIRNPKVLLGDLTVGDGPFKAKVIRMEKRRAIVDFGVGRPVRGVGEVKVLGSLQFNDAVEVASRTKGKRHSTNKSSKPWVEYDDEDEEQDLESGSIDELYSFEDDDEDEDGDDGDFEVDGEEEDAETDGFDDLADELLALRKDAYVEDGEVQEDITHFFDTNENGDLMYKDPNSGELTMLEEGHDTIFQEHSDDDAAEANNEEQSVEASLDGAYEDISDEDMSSLVSHNDDGSLTYTDPDTGETFVVHENDDEYQDMLTMKTLVDEYLPKTVETKQKPRLKKKIVNLGDYIDVYIVDVSKHSKQLRVTTNPLIQGQKPKQIKKQGATNKKFSRLTKQVGGLKNILTLKGERVHGVVKAASKTGGWVYVQPIYEKLDLPVGVGVVRGEGLSDLAAGDYVKCEFDGIDEERGQLALQVLHKLDGPPKEIDVNKAVSKRAEKDASNPVS